MQNSSGCQREGVKAYVDSGLIDCVAIESSNPLANIRLLTRDIFDCFTGEIIDCAFEDLLIYRATPPLTIYQIPTWFEPTIFPFENSNGWEGVPGRLNRGQFDTLIEVRRQYSDGRLLYRQAYLYINLMNNPIELINYNATRAMIFHPGVSAKQIFTRVNCSAIADSACRDPSVFQVQDYPDVGFLNIDARLQSGNEHTEPLPLGSYLDRARGEFISSSVASDELLGTRFVSIRFDDGFGSSKTAIVPWQIEGRLPEILLQPADIPTVLPFESVRYDINLARIATDPDPGDQLSGAILNQQVPIPSGDVANHDFLFYNTRTDSLQISPQPFNRGRYTLNVEVCDITDRCVQTEAFSGFVDDHAPVQARSFDRIETTILSGRQCYDLPRGFMFDRENDPLTYRLGVVSANISTEIHPQLGRICIEAGMGSVGRFDTDLWVNDTFKEVRVPLPFVEVERTRPALIDPPTRVLMQTGEPFSFDCLDAAIVRDLDYHDNTRLEATSATNLPRGGNLRGSANCFLNRISGFIECPNGVPATDIAEYPSTIWVRNNADLREFYEVIFERHELAPLLSVQAGYDAYVHDQGVVAATANALNSNGFDTAFSLPDAPSWLELRAVNASAVQVLFNNVPDTAAAQNYTQRIRASSLDSAYDLFNETLFHFRVINRAPLPGIILVNNQNRGLNISLHAGNNYLFNFRQVANDPDGRVDVDSDALVRSPFDCERIDVTDPTQVRCQITSADQLLDDVQVPITYHDIHGAGGQLLMNLFVASHTTQLVTTIARGLLSQSVRSQVAVNLIDADGLTGVSLSISDATRLALGQICEALQFTVNSISGFCLAPKTKQPVIHYLARVNDTFSRQVTWQNITLPLEVLSNGKVASTPWSLIIGAALASICFITALGFGIWRCLKLRALRGRAAQDQLFFVRGYLKSATKTRLRQLRINATPDEGYDECDERVQCLIDGLLNPEDHISFTRSFQGVTKQLALPTRAVVAEGAQSKQEPIARAPQTLLEVFTRVEQLTKQLEKAHARPSSTRSSLASARSRVSSMRSMPSSFVRSGAVLNYDHIDVQSYGGQSDFSDSSDARPLWEDRLLMIWGKLISLTDVIVQKYIAGHLPAEQMHFLLRLVLLLPKVCHSHAGGLVCLLKVDQFAMALCQRLEQGVNGSYTTQVAHRIAFKQILFNVQLLFALFRLANIASQSSLKRHFEPFSPTNLAYFNPLKKRLRKLLVILKKTVTKKEVLMQSYMIDAASIIETILMLCNNQLSIRNASCGTKFRVFGGCLPHQAAMPYHVTIGFDLLHRHHMPSALKSVMWMTRSSYIPDYVLLPMVELMCQSIYQEIPVVAPDVTQSVRDSKAKAFVFAALRVLVPRMLKRCRSSIYTLQIKRLFYAALMRARTIKDKAPHLAGYLSVVATPFENLPNSTNDAINIATVADEVRRIDPKAPKEGRLEIKPPVSALCWFEDVMREQRFTQSATGGRSVSPEGAVRVFEMHSLQGVAGAGVHEVRPGSTVAAAEGI